MAGFLTQLDGSAAGGLGGLVEDRIEDVFRPGAVAIYLADHGANGATIETLLDRSGNGNDAVKTAGHTGLLKVAGGLEAQNAAGATYEMPNGIWPTNPTIVVAYEVPTTAGFPFFFTNGAFNLGPRAADATLNVGYWIGPTSAFRPIGAANAGPPRGGLIIQAISIDETAKTVRMCTSWQTYQTTGGFVATDAAMSDYIQVYRDAAFKWRFGVQQQSAGTVLGCRFRGGLVYGGGPAWSIAELRAEGIRPMRRHLWSKAGLAAV